MLFFSNEFSTHLKIYQNPSWLSCPVQRKINNPGSGDPNNIAVVANMRTLINELQTLLAGGELLSGPSRNSHNVKDSPWINLLVRVRLTAYG